MQSLLVESSLPFPTTEHDHLSSFLEDFQDKNSHLFPSNDLPFQECEPQNNSEAGHTVIGSKRNRDSLYDSFNSWVRISFDFFLFDSPLITFCYYSLKTF